MTVSEIFTRVAVVLIAIVAGKVAGLVGRWRR